MLTRNFSLTESQILALVQTFNWLLEKGVREGNFTIQQCSGPLASRRRVEEFLL